MREVALQPSGPQRKGPQRKGPQRSGPQRRGPQRSGTQYRGSEPGARPAGTARGLAVAALVAVDAGERANEILPRLLAASSLDERDRSFATELVYGAVRMRRACDWLIARFARGELEPVVRAAARAGCYQLAFMRVPPYAAVSETVDLCPRRARPLLNAVLRRIGELVAAGPVQWPDVGTRLSYPDWLLRRLSADLGRERALAALAKMDEPAVVSKREDGYVQDPGSQAVGEQVARWADERSGNAPGGATGRERERPMLDMCAAPGGKATLLAAHAPFVVAGDLSVPRSRVVAANAAYLGLSNVGPVVADGAAPPFRPGSFGAVLVDAPCSGLGVLRRRPDARWRVRPGDVARLADLQRRLLAAAAPLVAPGGLIAYSVCTLTKEETSGVGQWLAGRLLPDWELLAPPGPPWEPLGPGALLLPQSAGTDGMYLIGLRRPPVSGLLGCLGGD